MRVDAKTLRQTAVMLGAMALAALGPMLFPFEPYSRSYYDPWAGIATTAAAVVALFTAFQSRPLSFAFSLGALAAALVVAAVEPADFNRARAAAGLLLLAGIWLGAATRQWWSAVVPLVAAVGVAALAGHVGDGSPVGAWTDALAGQPWLFSLPAALCAGTALWAPHVLHCPARRQDATLVLVAAAALVTFLLLKEYATGAPPTWRREAWFAWGLGIACAACLVAWGHHWPSRRNVVVTWAVASIFYYVGLPLAVTDPEAPLPAILLATVWLPLVPTALVAAGMGIQALRQRRVEAD